MPEQPASRKWTASLLLKGALILLLILLLLVFLHYLGPQQLLQQALSMIDGLGAWGPLLFVVLYVLATVFMIPGLILTLGAGVLFGVLQGTVLVSVASILGATAAFLLGRSAGRERVAAHIAKNPRVDAIDRAVAREGWKIVMLTRLSPVFPFNVLNYAFSLTRVSLRHYFWASWLGMLPGTAMYVYVGSLAGDLARLGSGEATRTAGEWALYLVGLVATVAVTLYVTHVARAALRDKV
ncbi:MAG: TVP38/TMEM64 family protein [Pedobacter sp.]